MWRSECLRISVLLGCLVLGTALTSQAGEGQRRPAANEAELRGWLENMFWYHRFTLDEAEQVLEIDRVQIENKLEQYGITAQTRPARSEDRLLVLPYPGGRHPRIGFLDGAIEPQRETKLSVFTPWDDHSYAVLDVPEAIWSNLGLTYLAHTHIDTVWTRQGVELPQQEWLIDAQGNFSSVRRLPNGIEFGVKVQPLRDHLRMKMWLTNGTDQPLSDLRVQNCVMLKGLDGFAQQTNDNKRFENGYAIAGAADGKRWVISGWDPVHRTWGNAPCPCLHSDPKFPDCPPGQTRWLRGWFSFYAGENIDQELARIEATGWRTHPLHHVTGNLIGAVTDSQSGQAIPSRLYVQNLDDQTWHFARSTAVAGSAVAYDKQLRQTASIEKHTTLSADGFQLDVPAGRYRLRAEHGKEWLPAETVVEVADQPVRVALELERFENMAARGWYSGDTHVHRELQELPNVVLAEDVNVALPLSYWVRDSSQTPAQQGPALPARPVYVDPSHVIYPINTEYEIFSIDGQRHTQGAVFVLNHQTPLDLRAPPVHAVAQEARRQRALLDLDKHSWNWSLMIIPQMQVDLFELSNNHHWRTAFGFPQWTLENAPPDWPEIQRSDTGFTERGWTEFGFQTYYALLNCGFRMRVSGGTASGVHPVPLGYGRVYVHTGPQFTYESWIEGLDQGRSFVTQGPLMDLRFAGQLPGAQWSSLPDSGLQISGEITSAHPLLTVEVIRNGEIIDSSEAQSEEIGKGGYRTRVDVRVPVDQSCWIAVRCFQHVAPGSPPGKVVFAHSNPVFIDLEGQPVVPRRRDVQYFADRMRGEIERNRGLLSDEALAEYGQALQVYTALLQRAR